MIQKLGNVWEYPADWICIPTNGFIKQDGSAVMGRGLALQAKTRFKGIDGVLGKRLLSRGNHVLTLKEVHTIKRGRYWILSFPVKEDWRDPADLDIIRRSCQELHRLWEESTLVTGKEKTVVLPRVGCGNGRREWSEVVSILEEELPESSFVVVSLIEEGYDG